MIVLNTTLYYFFFIIFIFSSIGYGILFQKQFLKIDLISENIFKYFFLGLIILFPLSFLNYFVSSYIRHINIFFLLIGILFFIYSKKINTNKVFLVVLIFFSGVLISKTHEDFSVYHFQHIKEISDQFIKFGLSNLDERYIYSSNFSYLQSMTNVPFFNLKLVNIPTFAMFFSLLGYLAIEIIDKKSVKKFICYFFLTFLIIKYKRFSEFGYDYPGQFLLLFLFIEYVYEKKNNLFKNISFFLLFLISLLIKLTNIYFLPFLIYYIFYKKIDFKKIITNKVLILFSVLIFTTFSLNSFMKTGCLNYLIKSSCFSNEKSGWAINHKQINDVKKLTKNWARGFYHQKGDKINEIDYNKELNWFSNWFDVHFKIKILPFVTITIILFILIRYLISDNRSYNHQKQDQNMLYITCIFSLLLWLMYFPQARFGFFVIILTVYLSLKKIFGYSNKIYIKKSFSFLIIAILYFNITNFIRINDEKSRNDVYQYLNFPWFPEPKFNFKKEKNNNITVYRSTNNDHFWRTCWNAKYMCINHDENVSFKKFGRFILIKKKN